MTDKNNINEVLIERLMMYFRKHFSDEVIAGFRPDFITEELMFGSSLRVLMPLPIEKLKTFTASVKFSTPKTWFDHLRLSVAPTFMVKHFPISYHTEEVPVEVDVSAVYPKLPVAFPEYADSMRFHYGQTSARVEYPEIEPLADEE